MLGENQIKTVEKEILSDFSLFGSENDQKQTEKLDWKTCPEIDSETCPENLPGKLAPKTCPENLPKIFRKIESIFMSSF